MINTGTLVFSSIVIVWGFCFFRILLISLKAIDYVKKKYPRKWEDELQVKIGTSIFGGNTVFQFFSEFNDPVINNYKKKWETAFKQLLFSVVFSFLIIAGYIYTESVKPRAEFPFSGPVCVISRSTLITGY